MIPVCEGLAKTSLYRRVDWSLVPALAHNQIYASSNLASAIPSVVIPELTGYIRAVLLM